MKKLQISSCGLIKGKTVLFLSDCIRRIGYKNIEKKIDEDA